MGRTYEVRSLLPGGRENPEPRSRWNTFKLALESAQRYQRGYPINNGWHTPPDADTLFIVPSDTPQTAFHVREARWTARQLVGRLLKSSETEDESS